MYDLQKFKYIGKSLLLPSIAFILTEYIETKIILRFLHRIDLFRIQQQANYN